MKIVEDPIELENNIRRYYFSDYYNHTEALLLQDRNDDDEYCLKCGRKLEPLTYLDPDFCHQECTTCLQKKRLGRDILIESLIKYTREYYNKILGDRYYHLFIADNLYYETTYTHTYPVFKKVISSLDLPNRNDIWFLDFNPGYPRIISMENLSGLKVLNMSNEYNIVSEKDKLIVNNYEVKLPEPTLFDPRHHTRYSILNKQGDRKSKRFRIGEKCFRFYNTGNDDIKSIFKITKDGVEIPIVDIPLKDIVIIRLAILRNKTFIKLVFDIILELARYASEIRDSVFLKNTLHLDPKSPAIFNIIWDETSIGIDSNNINISIM